MSIAISFGLIAIEYTRLSILVADINAFNIYSKSLGHARATYQNKGCKPVNRSKLA